MGEMLGKETWCYISIFFLKLSANSMQLNTITLVSLQNTIRTQFN